MKNKILVIVYVPLIEKEFDIYIPIAKKVGTVKNLIIKIIEESSEGTFVNDGCKHYMINYLERESMNNNS